MYASNTENTNMKEVDGMPDRVTGRFAPTPSGRLHLGNILCAMLAYLSARSAGGRFLLRIEDLDVPRCPARLAAQAIEDLTWLGFVWDEPPVYQSQRSELYEQAIRALSALGLVYPCFCTRAQLHASIAPNLGDTQVVYPGTCARLSGEEIARRMLERAPAMRLRVPDETVSFTDGLYGIQTENLARDCGDFVLRRSDGLYGYQLAVVVDDAMSGVNQVVRGRDILTATPRQIFLQRMLGYPQPQYIHIPLLMDANGHRLAKRDHALSLDALAKRFRPEELCGMLAHCCGLTVDDRPRSLEELIPCFDAAKLPTGDICLPARLHS